MPTKLPRRRPEFIPTLYAAARPAAAPAAAPAGVGIAVDEGLWTWPVLQSLKRLGPARAADIRGDLDNPHLPVSLDTVDVCLNSLVRKGMAAVDADGRYTPVG